MKLKKWIPRFIHWLFMRRTRKYIYKYCDEFSWFIFHCMVQSLTLHLKKNAFVHGRFVVFMMTCRKFIASTPKYNASHNNVCVLQQNKKIYKKNSSSREIQNQVIDILVEFVYIDILWSYYLKDFWTWDYKSSRIW